MRWLGRKRKPRFCVLGLDGVPIGLLRRLVEDGTMPRLGALLPQGRLQQMRTTLPEISAVSWSSFMTGADPGTHGIFGFVDLKPNSYAIRFPSYADLQAPTIWDRLGQRGRRSVVVNQPATYPARRIEGALISGFVAIELRKAVWPPQLLSRLQSMRYQIDVDTMRAREDHDLLLHELQTTLQAREQAVEWLWQEVDWDYFELVVTGTDRLHHYLWPALEDTSHPRHRAVRDYYRQVDGLVGRVYDRFAGSYEGAPAECFMLLSDHGATETVTEVYVNAWLRQQDFLRFEADEPESLEQMSAGSRAFALEPARLYVNQRRRFPQGCVSEDEVEGLKRELAEGLEALEFEGRKVVARVVDRSEAYSGPLAKQGPDLLLVPERGFDLKASVRQPRLFARTALTGTHTWDDAFCWSGAAVKQDPCITDLAPVILGAVTGEVPG